MFKDFMQIRFVRDIATMQVGRVILIACGLITSIVYPHSSFVGLDGFGLYGTVLAFAALAAMISNLGQQATALTFFAEAYGSKSDQDQLKIMHYYAVMAVLTIILLALVALLAPLITTWTHNDPGIGKLAQIIFISSMFEPVFGWLAICLQTVREIKVLTVLETVKVVTQIVLAILLIMAGFGVAGILIGALITSITYFILSLIVYPWLQYKYQLPKVRALFGLSNWSHIKHYFKDGLWIAIDKNLGNLYPNIFIFMLSTQVSEAVVGLFRLGFKFAGLPASFALASISKLAASVIPKLAGQSKAVLRKSVRRLLVHACAIHAVLTAGAMVCVPLFLPVFYEAHLQIMIYPFLVIITLNLLLAVHALITPILRVYSLTHWPAILNIIGTAVAALVFYALIIEFRPTLALYASLIIYHIIIGLTVFPAWRALKHKPAE